MVRSLLAFLHSTEIPAGTAANHRIPEVSEQFSPKSNQAAAVRAQEVRECLACVTGREDFLHYDALETERV